ncbi:MAG TPA: deoxyribose-phosphate aldolase [Steroidobacteraceae bacterium]|jgi:deoxyribose-phosphate aldolase|nr:deoxyribose-phosphate aldolase [Steroidobacteraceae bacterium]
MSPAASASRAHLARQLMALVDLTSLNESDDAASVRALSILAGTSPVKPAAVCIWARWIPAALAALGDTGIKVCAVANFPAGAAAPDTAAAETAAAIAAGAVEVDVVFPYRALLAGDSRAGMELVRRCREACGESALLKVILETGQLSGPDNIRRAAEIAIEGGAHFLKTSTGKTQPAATSEAAEVLLDVIAAARRRGRSIGFKASGGIRTIEDALIYLGLYEQKFGSGSASAGNFRIGASALFNELLAAAAA